MPLNGSGTASKPTGTTASPNTTIESAKFNSVIDDIYSILNTARPVAYGGTGGTTAAEARTNLGLVIGTNVQAYDADLTTLAGAFTSASASGPASLALAEDTDNGTSKVTLQAPSALSADATVTLPSATSTLLASTDVAAASDFRANTADKVLDTDGVWAAAAEVTLTDAATVVFDQSSGINFKVTLGGNRTMGQPSSTINGKTGRIIVKQDATGSRTLTWHADFEFANGTAPTLSTTAGAEDVFYYDQIAANRTLITGPVRAIA